MSPGLSRRIQSAVCQDTGRSSTQIKAVTGADCSPITVRRHLRLKGFKNKNTSLKVSSPWTPQNWLFGLCKRAPSMGHWKVEQSSSGLKLLIRIVLPHEVQSWSWSCLFFHITNGQQQSLRGISYCKVTPYNIRDISYELHLATVGKKNSLFTGRILQQKLREGYITLQHQDKIQFQMR